MKPRISILVPTWGRPERLRAMIESVRATESERCEILVRVAVNDPRATDYASAPFDQASIFVVPGHDSYGRGIEWLQERAQGEILLAASDDVLFRTTDWDELVREAFAAVPDGLLVAYANNGQDREKCEHFFTTRRWIDTVGYMVWPEFRHFCVDQWVEELAAKIGRLAFLRDVVIEHMHRKYRKAPNDATYELVRGNSGTNDADNALYAQRAPERANALAKLKTACAARTNNPEARP